MLISVTVMPIIFDMLNKVPEGAPESAAPVTVLVALVVIVGVALKARGQARLQVPVIGVVIGSVVAGGFGRYNFNLVAGASWVGLPNNGMTVGGLTAIILTVFQKLRASRSSRIEMELDTSALPNIREFLEAFVSRNGWDRAMMTRLDVASEETLLTLLQKGEGSASAMPCYGYHDCPRGRSETGLGRSWP